MPARAVALVAPGRYELREFPLPEPEPGAVVIRNGLSGICGTDKHTYEGHTVQYAGTGNPSTTPFPIIQGHENVGAVAAVGGTVRDYDGDRLEPGDRVVLGPNLICGHCPLCRRQVPYTLCENIRDYGNTISAAEPPHLFGGWAEYLYALPGSFLFRVPDNLPDAIAVLAEVFAVTACLDRAQAFGSYPGEGFRFGDTVLVYGVGPLGLCHLLKAKLLGAGAVIAVDVSPHRLDFARRLGADHVIDARAEPDVATAVQDLTSGRGADVVVECVGRPEILPAAFDALRVGGTFLEVGNFSDLGTVALAPNRHLCSKGIRLFGVSGQEPGAYGPGMRALARLARELPLDEFVSHRYPLSQAAQAVARAIDPTSLKVVIDPWA